MGPSIHKRRIRVYLSRHPIGLLFFFQECLEPILLDFSAKKKSHEQQTFYFSRRNVFKNSQKNHICTYKRIIKPTSMLKAAQAGSYMISTFQYVVHAILPQKYWKKNNRQFLQFPLICLKKNFRQVLTEATYCQALCVGVTLLLPKKAGISMYPLFCTFPYSICITIEQVSVVMWLSPRPSVRETRVQIPQQHGNLVKFILVWVFFNPSGILTQP